MRKKKVGVLEITWCKFQNLNMKSKYANSMANSYARYLEALESGIGIGIGRGGGTCN